MYLAVGFKQEIWATLTLMYFLCFLLTGWPGCWCALALFAVNYSIPVTMEQVKSINIGNLKHKASIYRENITIYVPLKKQLQMWL